MLGLSQCQDTSDNDIEEPSKLDLVKEIDEEIDNKRDGEKDITYL